MSEVFTEAERERLHAAVAAAEARTGAEVVLMVVRRATETRTAEMTAAALLALAVPAALLPFDQVSALVIWLAQLVVFVLAAVLLPASGLGHRLIAKERRSAMVRAAAEAQFFSHGLRNTDERAAVLIFVSMAEREAHVLFDDAAGAKVGPAQWRGVAGDLARGIKAGDAVAALEAAATRAGDLLAPHFPRREDDTDELPNVVLPG